MSDPTDDNPTPDDLPAKSDEPTAREPSPDLEVEESTPDGASTAPPPVPEPEVAEEKEKAPHATAPAEKAPTPTPGGAAPEDEEDEAPQLVWYVLKVQSSREDTIRDALERRVKIQGLGRYFGRIVVPTEKITEIRNNKKRIVERKTYPGYLMIEMELNEKTWFLVRETPGVGDFVGAHQKPTQMTEADVNQMLGQQTAAETEASPKVRIDVERGDRVKIKDGPFESFEGTVEEVIEARGLVKVMLIIFNRPTPVDMEYWQVERI
ncbi:MAG: transcription termination/antitermination protein NusG [Isosphaeraceae bacterium]